MFDWFAEGQTTGYVIALFLGSFLGFLWFQKTRDKFGPLALILFFLGSVWLLDRIWETPKESMAKSIQALREGGINKDWNRVKEFISEKFQHPSLGTKGELENYFKSWRNRLPDARLVCWGFATPKGTDDQIEFMFKAEGEGRVFFAKVLATMEKTPKGWKLKGLKLFNPVADLQEMPIP